MRKHCFLFLTITFLDREFFFYLLGDMTKKILSRFLLNRKIKKKEILTLFFKFNIPPLTKL
jgi:hypothetical protein